MLEVPIQAPTLAEALARAALEKQALDLVILDMEGLVHYTDIFIICSARNRRQMSAIADAVRDVAKSDFDTLAKGVEEAGRWVLVDFGSVVVHIFDEPHRGHYDLDTLWSDAPRLPVPDVDIEDESETGSLFQL